APALVIVVVDAAATTVHVLELSGPALSIQVLVLRQLERGLEGDVAAGGDLRGADQPARFRRDEDCAVCRTRSVQRRGIRTLQHRDGLDVVRIDILDGVAVVDRVVAARAAAYGGIAHRNTVDHEQRLVVASQGVRSAYHDA